jgi:hypothetical protein
MNTKNNKQTTNDSSKTNQGSGSELDTAPCSPLRLFDLTKTTPEMVEQESNYESPTLKQKQLALKKEVYPDQSPQALSKSYQDALELGYVKPQNPNFDWEPYKDLVCRLVNSEDQISASV